MRNPTTALTWELWRRNRSFALAAIGCLGFCALLNLVAPERFSVSPPINALNGFLMVASMSLVFAAFNYTEFNATLEWHGFPYRLFALPVPTWKLVAMPMLGGVVAVELIFGGWIKLVWTRGEIPFSGWLAMVMGAYMVFFQTAVWSLAKFRIGRVLILSVGGASSVLVAFLPLASRFSPSPWFREERLMVMLSGLALLAFIMAGAVVARQRSGGGRRQSWLRERVDRISDAMPRRSKVFKSPAAAQFWFEWRRAGFLLPMCAALVLVVVIGPIAWFYRDDAHYTGYILDRILAVPIILAFIIGKGFSRPDFWSKQPLSTFLAVRPLSTDEFVATKMKVAAVSAAMTCALVLGFIVGWLGLVADTKQLKEQSFVFLEFYPHTWPVILALLFGVLMMVVWRGMVGGMWVGLSRRGWFQGVWMAAQMMAPVAVLISCGIWSHAIDREIKKHPDVAISTAICAAGWILAALVIAKAWLSVFSWSKISPRWTGQYLLIWSGITISFAGLAVLATPWADTYRVEHLAVLAALWLMPIGRLGLASLALAGNRHR